MDKVQFGKASDRWWEEESEGRGWGGVGCDVLQEWLEIQANMGLID